MNKTLFLSSSSIACAALMIAALTGCDNKVGGDTASPAAPDQASPAAAASVAATGSPSPAVSGAASPVADASSSTSASATDGPPGPAGGGAGFDTAPFKGNGKMVKTASGLQYEDMTVGQGYAAVPGKQCVMHYTGTLENGTKFDSSRDRGQPFSFVLGTGNVIKGWDEGVAGMKVGGRRKLTIPYQLAYGEEGRPPTIPPKAKLIFDVELMEVH